VANPCMYASGVSRISTNSAPFTTICE
jgi:hypothetical protein